MCHTLELVSNVSKMCVYIERHHLTISKALRVLVMRQEKCVDLILRVKIVTELSVFEWIRQRLLHAQTNERPM